MKKNKETILSQVRTLKFEFKALSDKKPNDQVNLFKLKYVNQSLQASNEILGENKPYDNFDTFNESELPTNSDVLIILSLYLNTLCNA
jgi:hypothetical protein